MKINLKVGKGLLAAAVLAAGAFGTATPVSAASFSVSGGGNVKPGESFKVYISLDGEGRFVFSGNNVSSILGVDEYNAIWCNGSCSVTATAGNSGTASVTVTADDVAANDGETVITGSKTVSASIKAPVVSKPSTNNNSQPTNTPSNTQKEEPKPEVKKNSDSSLKSLSVSEGTLSPKFSRSEKSYKVSLPNTATSIKISASANDSKASVSGTGTKKLDAGNNKLSVTVTAEDGSMTTYTINVYVDEKPLAYVNYNGAKLGVARNMDAAPKLSKAFSKTKIKIDDIEVEAMQAKSLGITLLYLQKDDEGSYYIYDTEKKEITSVYQPMGILGQNIVKVDVPEEVQKKEGMTFTTVKVDGKEFSGWTFNDKAFENYALIYVMSEGGVYQYYQYEKTQNTLQLYSGSAAITQDAYEKYVKESEDAISTKQTMVIALGVAAGVFAVLFVGALVVALRRKKGGRRYEKVSVSSSDLSRGADVEINSLHKMKDDEEGEF